MAIGIRKIILPIMFSIILLSSTPILLLDASASFPGINGKISYDKRTGPGFTGPRDVFVMNPDGTGQTNTSNDAGFFDGDGSWTADGSIIVFESTRDGDPNIRQIYVMNADGTSPTNLTNTPGDTESRPHWQPVRVLIGGTILPIDTTSLILAGAQMSAAWMIPVIIAGIGIAIVITRKF